MAVRLSEADARKLLGGRAGASDQPARKVRVQRDRRAVQILPGVTRQLDARDRLLCLDVSSTAVGWAFLLGDGTPVRWGVDRSTSTDPLVRTGELADWSVARAATEPTINRVVLEWQDHSNRTDHGATAATVAHAQGAVWQALRALDRFPVVCVPVHEWTAFEPKDKRADKVRLLVPEYRPDGDTGLDAADALGLGLWFCGCWPARERKGRKRAR